MARVCHVTDAVRLQGTKRSHSNRANKRTWKANLQKVNFADGKPKRVLVSARALKSGKVERV